MKIIIQVRHLKTNETVESVFDRLPILVGRSKICDLVVSDTLASRQHCVLESDESGKLILVDLESANGTLFKGDRIKKQILGVGDSFQIGDFEFLIDRISRIYEESTVHDLTPIGERLAPEKTGTKLTSEQTEPEAELPRPQVSPAPEQAAPKLPHDSRDVTLKTPSVVQLPAQRPVGRTKDWVQVSMFWKDSLINIKCFDRGDTVAIGKNNENDFCVELASLPDHFPFLKIHPQGLEVNLHPAMTGVVETRTGTENLDELRKKARQTDFGFSTFIPLQDRCLLEIGPFSFFIRSVQLKISEPLEAPLVKEPIFSGILSMVATSFVLFILVLGSLAAAKTEEEPEEKAFVRLELRPEMKPPTPKEPTPPPPKPRPQAQAGAKAQQARNLSGTQGAGAKSAGAEGQRGRETGSAPSRAREIGFQTKKTPPRQATPKGAMGQAKSPEQARRGKRPDQGTGTGRPQPRGTGQQAPSREPTPKPQVRVEDQGVLGVLGETGGGGSANSGGEMEGAGLGGNLEGALAGLERGSDSDSPGTGGRGQRGREFGGGGESIEVGGLGTAGRGGGRSGFGLGTSGTKGEAEVSYVAEEIEVRDGLTREEIERVVRAHQNEIRACYEKALIQSGNMDLAGRLKVGWFVNRDGRATNVVQESDFGRQAGLFDCVSGRIRSWQFPRPRGGSGAQVSWPFVFRRGG